MKPKYLKAGIILCLIALFVFTWAVCYGEDFKYRGKLVLDEVQFRVFCREVYTGEFKTHINCRTIEPEITVIDKFGHKVPDLSDYVFKQENGTLYWANKDNVTMEIYADCAPEFFELNQDSCIKERNYSWRSDIPGLLMRELLQTNQSD